MNTTSDLRIALIKKIGIVLLTGATAAVALNCFLQPAHTLAAGVNGLAQLVSDLLVHGTLHLSLGVGAWIFLLNIPIAFLGFFKLGFRLMLWTFLNILSVSIFTMFVPLIQVTDNALMGAIIGGVLLGVGAGFSLKYGFTTGGLDVVSLVLSQTTGRTVGNFMMLTNGVIALLAGFVYSWESALYTIISIYCMSYVVDIIHTNQQKVTAFIVTSKADEVACAITERVTRGMTILPSYGGFTKKESQTIMMVITRYELYDLDQAVMQADPDAFLNIVPTQSIMGNFADEKEQRKLKVAATFPNFHEESPDDTGAPLPKGDLK